MWQCGVWCCREVVETSGCEELDGVDLGGKELGGGEELGDVIDLGGRIRCECLDGGENLGGDGLDDEELGDVLGCEELDGFDLGGKELSGGEELGGVMDLVDKIRCECLDGGDGLDDEELGDG
ncbi:hypothetical protein K2173_027640 [Erythroxylum novogranatense]|uniref:Uncharacterized protein n=1 Tax=Erythroxylum novogranatense TaxID=1862640 RepID=A0AAV8U275_9ROSI|nr:hypothetical protein K2173_027640 [Erythroxylum novogranatense]